MKGFTSFSIKPMPHDAGQEELLSKKEGDHVSLSVSVSDRGTTIPYVYKILKIMKWSNGNLTYVMEPVGWIVPTKRFGDI